MRIGVVSAHFFPERVGIGVYTHDMCRFFAAAGHAVSVVTTFPFYPELRRDAAYKGRLFLTEQADGITVHRCFAPIPSRWSVRGRIAHELSFAVSAMPRVWRLKVDVLLLVSPQFAPVVAASVVARLRGVPTAVHVQDLQPDAAVQLGMLRNRAIVRGLYRAERWLYRSAALVSALDEPMRARIVAKGVPLEDVVVFPNWVDVDVAASADDARAFRREHGLGDQFLVTYSGSWGVKQGLELIIETAAIARDQPDVRFVLLGDGATREGLETMAHERGLTNVTFLPLLPLDRFRGFLAATDVSVIPQRPEVRDLVVPSKVLRILAGGSPIVAAAHPDGGLARFLGASGGGILVPRGDAPAVWRSIQKLKADPDLRRSMGMRGAAYVSKEFVRGTVLGRYLERLKTVAGKASR